MRKLLVCLLAAAMLLAFTGVANAVADSEVLVFTAPISFPLHLIQESPGALSTTLDVPKNTLVTKTQTFTGFLVANVTVTSEPESAPNDIAITEIFICGNRNSGTTAAPILTPAEADFTNLVTVLSDTFAGPKGVDALVTVDMIGTGDFFSPPASAAVGIDYLNAKATGEFFSTTQTLSKIRVSGTIAGGNTTDDLTTDLAAPSGKLFNATFSTTTLAQNATLSPTVCTAGFGATCSATGTVVCVTP